MGILELMLGKPGEGEQGVEGRSYMLPKETHDFVHPVAVRREELDAVAALLEADADAPSLEESADELQDAFDDLFDGAGPDAAELLEREREARRSVETVLETWREQVDDEANAIGVVYARPADHEALVSFVKRCKRRGEREDDAFELPDSFPAVAPLLARLEDAIDDQYRAVIHTDLLP